MELSFPWLYLHKERTLLFYPMSQKILTYIEKLCACPERRGSVVPFIQKYITDELERASIPYQLHTFLSETPKAKAELVVDAISIPCLGTSFVSGTIDSKYAILSSTIPSRFNLENPNINFNPYADAISCSNFYFAPAVAVARADIAKVIAGESVVGTVMVEKIQTEVAHILVGNAVNPKNIVFAHYDSISVGAIDNASGVAVCLVTIIENPGLLVDTLFVFDPAEELSFDMPTYWGYGFREFEKKFFMQMQQAEKIIPIDCVGNGPVTTDTNPKILFLAFPIRQFEELKGKMVTLYSDIAALQKVYHSAADVPALLEEIYLQEAREKLIALLVSK